MSELFIGTETRPAATVFHLLGRNEDDLTRSMAWGMSQSDAFAELLVDVLALPFEVDEPSSVRVQHAIKTRGRTDIELRIGSALLIFEAKVGWNLPRAEQLAGYEDRLIELLAESKSGVDADPIQNGALITLSECSADWAARKLPPPGALARRHITWHQVIETADVAAAMAGVHTKRVLRDLADYLRSTTMVHDDPASQMTWVVPLSGVDYAPGSSVTFVETVQQGWYYNKARKVPKGAFNFIGFRWENALREIRFVKSRRLFSDPHEVLPDIFSDSAEWEDHELFELGPAIAPPAPVPYGKLYAPGYHRALLDCLLTSASVEEARDASHRRFEEAGLPF